MWAFSDESERSGTMLLSVVLIRPADISAARVRLSGLLLPGQRSLHTSNESARRRRLILDAVGSTAGLSAAVLRYRRPPRVDRPAGRHLLLQVVTAFVVGSGVKSWVLDNQEPRQVARDRACIAHVLRGFDPQLHPTYDHGPRHSEPLLWAADAVCWAAGAGSEWQQRLVDILTVREIAP